MGTTARLTRNGSLAALLLILAACPALAATIQIVNLDGPMEGFNDPAARAAVGGNPGTTLGQQRQNVFNQAAGVWGSILPSSVTIRVGSSFDALTPCTATSGVLGSTGPNGAFANFSGAEKGDTWYVSSLANKMAGADLDPSTDDMRSRFNSSVDNSTCLGTVNWYYGYDHNEGTNIDLFAVVLHELAHGLGFVSLVDETTGQYCCPPSLELPDVFTTFLYDDTQQLRWDQMDNAQRAASAINTGNLVWRGSDTYSQVPNFLEDRPFVRFVGSGFVGEKQFGTAEFGPPLGNNYVSGNIVLVDDGVPPTSDACDPPFVNAAQIAGNVCLIDRGICTFAQKVADAQDAGAIAVIIANNTTGIVNMAGNNPSIVIPTVSITQSDGNALKSALLSGPVFVEMGAENGVQVGADVNGFARMYAPNPDQPGSSVSHFDDVATPNLLMEPAINFDLTSSVDLTRYVFEDIGWFPRVLSVNGPPPGSLRLDSGAPNPFRVRTSIRYELAQPGYTEMGVYDISGRMVKRLFASWMPSGSGSIVWDATDDAGRRVSPGVYLYRVRTNGQSRAQRVVVAD